MEGWWGRWALYRLSPIHPHSKVGNLNNQGIREVPERAKIFLSPAKEKDSGDFTSGELQTSDRLFSESKPFLN